MAAILHKNIDNPDSTFRRSHLVSGQLKLSRNTGLFSFSIGGGKTQGVRHGANGLSVRPECMQVRAVALKERAVSMPGGLTT